MSGAGPTWSKRTVNLLALATTIPAGRLSTKLRSNAVEVLAPLSMVNVRVLRPPKKTVSGEKLLLKAGRSVLPELTVRSSVADPLLPASEVRSPEMLV